MDELTMFTSLRPDSEVLPADERAALRVSLFGSSADGSGADPVLDAPRSIADDPESTLIALESLSARSGPRRRSRRVTHGLLAIAVAAAVVTTLVLISRDHTTAPADTPIPTAIANGWVAFAAADGNDDGDIYLVREGSSPRRIAGSDTDTTIEECPAFSPDGTRLAFGQADGSGYQEGGAGDAALVITDLSADGVRTATTTIALDGMSDPPCGVWSSDGRWVAFGVDTSAGGPDGEPEQVWVVDTESDDIRRLTGLSATDLDWVPHATELAVASDGVMVYSVTADESHPLGDAQDVRSVTWSPDGQTIAFMRTSPGLTNTHHDLWLMDADGTNERILVPEIPANHGVGPVWSPDGERIAYQRLCDHPIADPTERCFEEHEVVLVSVADGNLTVIPPPQTTGPDGQPHWWYPYSVTWSPDSNVLLYHAWRTSAEVTIGGVFVDRVVAVSLDGETPPVVLSGHLGASVYSGDPWLPIQSWGRQQTG